MMTDFERFVHQQELKEQWIHRELKNSVYFSEQDGRTEMMVVKTVELTKTRTAKKARRFGHSKYVDYYVGGVNFFKVEVIDAADEIDESERFFVIVREYGAVNLKRERKMTCAEANKFYKELKKDGYR